MGTPCGPDACCDWPDIITGSQTISDVSYFADGIETAVDLGLNAASLFTYNTTVTDPC